MLLEMPAAVLCVLKCPAGTLGKIHPGIQIQQYSNMKVGKS